MTENITSKTIDHTHNYIKPWYKRILCKHKYLKTSQSLHLNTGGLYSDSYIQFKICNKCHKLKGEIIYTKKNQEYKNIHEN